MQIRGPIGEQRLDEHFAWLRQAVRAGYSDSQPTIEDCRLNYDWRRCFPKDAEAAIEEMVANADAEMENIINRFKKRR